MRRGFGRSAPLCWAGLRATLAGMPRRSVVELAKAIRVHGLTLAAVIAAGDRRFGDRLAVVDDAGRHTYADLARLTANARSELAAAGCGPGGALVVAVGDRVALLATLAAGTRLGCRVTPVDPRTPPKVLAGVLTRALAETLVCDPGPDAEICAESQHFLGSLRIGSVPSPQPSGYRHRGGLVLLTSGSTSRPKSIRTRQSLAQAWTAFGLLGATGIGSGPVLVLSPLNHGQGLAIGVAGLLSGSPLVLSTAVRRARPLVGAAEGEPPRPSRAAPSDRGHEILECAARERAAVITGVPAHLEFVAADDRPTALPRLRRIASGGDRLRPETARRLAERFGPIVVNLYGATETGTATIALPRDLAADPASVGRPAPGVRVGVVREDGQLARRGEVGRIRISSPLVARSPDGSDAKKLRARGGVLTDDAGAIDANGRVHVLGRLDGTLGRGGEVIDPREAELALAGVAGVAEADVSAVSDPVFGYRLTAHVRAHDGAVLDASALRAALARELHPAALPAEIEIE